MALSGNKYTGADLALSVGGTAVEQAVLRSVTISESKDVHDATGGGGGAKEFLGGEQSGTVAIDLWSSDDDADVRDLFDLGDDDGAAVVVYPKGNSSGQISISFSAIWTSVEEGVEKNSVVPLRVNGQISGAITRSTVSS
ncbi:MAG TPA: hypothetical protein VF982_02620 [Anaerolineales bacterium]